MRRDESGINRASPNNGLGAQRRDIYLEGLSRTERRRRAHNVWRTDYGTVQFMCHISHATTKGHSPVRSKFIKLDIDTMNYVFACIH